MNQPWQLINFHGLNLVKSAHNQQEFLKLVDKKNFSESDIKRAIYRYEKHWLSLCDKIFKNQFDFSKYYPPLDVAWIWHCHMLSSIHYRQDLEETFGTIFPHSCQSLNEMHLKQVQTVSIWENETGLSFDHNKPNSVDASYENFKSKFSCDLFESSKRQKSFNYQVSLPHFHSEKFLKTALERYRKLLYYNKCYPERFIVPCYAIAIIWHTHQLFPIEYNQDCCKILGRIFPHDNSVNDRLQDSKPGTCIFNYGKYHNYYSESFTPWKITFREDFFFSGGMYRGSETNEIKYKTSNDLNLQDYKFLRSANFRIDELTLNNEKRILLISLFRTTNELIISDEILTNKFKTNREIVFDESETRLILKINLKDKFIEQFINVIKIGHRSSSKNSINLDVSLEMPIKNENLTKEQTLNINFGNLNFSGYLKYSIFNVKSEKKLIKFDFVKNNFEVVDKFFIIDECKSFDLKDRLEDGEVKKVNISGIQDRFLPMIENCVQNLENEPGLRACHSVTVRNKEIKVYDAEILHIPVLKWSSIRILYNGGCVASAHLIDSSQLPSPRQVEPTFCSLNPNRERALLVRGENGDFAIIKASWEGKKLTSWKGSFEENSGYLYVTIVELDSKSQINFNVNVHSNESFEFILCGSRVKISLRDENANLIIENENNIYTERLLCIALGISLLHVLLQPKSTLTIDQSRLKLEECRPINLIDIKKFSFLDIIGYHDLLKHKHFILMSLSRERHSIFNGWIDMFMHGLDYYFTIYIRNGGGRHSSGYSGGGHSSGYSGGGSNFVDYSGGGCYSGGGGGGGCDSGGGGGGGCDSGGGCG